MKIKKTSPKKTLILSALGAIVLLLGVGVAFALGAFDDKSRNAAEASINTDEATNEEKKAGETTKLETISADASKGSDNTQTVDPSSIPMQITVAAVNMEALNIRTDIGTLSSEGTCELMMTSGEGATYSATANVQALASTSTCKGFDVPVAQLKSGLWRFTVNYINGNSKGQASGEVTI